MKLTTYDLREITNHKCIKKCNPEKRKETTDNDICRVTKSELDELPVRCVGDWHIKKFIDLINILEYFQME